MNKIISDTQIHTQKPEGFIAQVEIAACYIELGDRFLLLQRAGKEAGTWAVPAGKLEKDETPHSAAIRELFEETGIVISEALYLDRLFFCRPNLNYVYHLFKIELSEIPEVRLSDEHLQFTWATLTEIERLPLMAGAKGALEHYLKLTKGGDR
jgi:8-oxo-dGTP pyrophosphatase MutT (NUDIX family)